MGWRSSAVQSRDSLAGRRGLLPHLEQLERAHDAGAVGGSIAAAAARRPRGQLGVEGLGAALVEPRPTIRSRTPGGGGGRSSRSVSAAWR